MSTETLKKKLKYVSWHRGTKESDNLFGPFADEYLGSFDSAQLDEYKHIMDQTDVDLMDWLLDRAAVPEAFNSNSVFKLLKQYVANKNR